MFELSFSVSNKSWGVVSVVTKPFDVTKVAGVAPPPLRFLAIEFVVYCDDVV